MFALEGSVDCHTRASWVFHSVRHYHHSTTTLLLLVLGARFRDCVVDEIRLSRMALSLGEQSARLGLHEAATRLFDISGEDARLAGYLNGHVNGHTFSSGSQNEAAQTSPDGVETQPEAAAEVEAAAADQLRALTSAREAGGGRGVGKATGEVSAQAAGLFRRTSLLAGIVRFPQVGHASVIC